jgi:hypothetical protein
MLFQKSSEVVPRHGRFLLVWAFLTFASVSYGQFTSVVDGNWNDGGTWGNVSPGTEGVDYPGAGDNAIILSNVDVVATQSAAGIFVGAGFSLNITSTGVLLFSGQLEIEDDGLGGNGFVQVTGTLRANQGSSTLNDSPFSVTISGIYEHNFTTTAGNIIIADWQPGSTCRVVGYTSNSTAPGNLTQTFHHFTWNCPNFVGGGGGTTFIALNGALATVNGNFTVTNTGGASRTLRIFDATSSNTFSVGGDLVVNGSARLVLSSSGTANQVNIGGNLTFSNTATVIHTISSTGSTTVNVTGSFSTSVSSGTLFLNLNATATPGTGIINVKGNFSNGPSCTIGRSSLAGGSAQINFDGTSVQTFSNSGPTFSGAVNFTIFTNAIVDLGLSALSGSGTLTVQTGATIRVGSTDGSGAIQSGTSAGNIRVSGVRTFNSGSSIVYSGASAQFMGNGHPSSAGVNCTISNSSGVSLASNVTVGGVLTLATGNLSISSSTLSLNGSFVPNANSLVVIAGSSISIGGSGAFGTLVTTGSSTINNFTINRVSSGTVTLGANLGIGGTFTQTNGNLVLNGRTLTLSGPYSRTNGSLAIDAASSLVIDGTGALPAEIAFTTPQQINSLTLDRSGETLTTSSSFTVTNLNLLSGTFNNAQNITMATGGVLTRTEGSLINNTPQAQTSYDVVYDISLNIVTGSEIPLGADELRNLTKNGAANLTLDQPIIITGNLTVNNGLLISGANSIELQGNFAANSATNLSGSNFIFAGTNSSISGAASLTFDVLTVAVGSTVALNKDINISGNFQNNGTLTPGTRLVTFSGSTTLSGTSVTNLNRVTITGTLTAPASPGSFDVSGNWINNGTFNNNNGTVSFNGTTTISGSSQSNFFHVTIAGSSTLTGSSGIMGIAGNFVNNGTFNANNGTVLFNGTVLAQTVSGSALTFNDITVSNPITPGLQIANTSRLNGTLTLTAGAFFDADGPSGTGVFIVSSTSQTQGGRIAALPNPTNFTGQVTIERFVHGRPGGDYRYLSMPITSGANVGVWRNSIFVTGNFSDRNTNADNANILDGGNTNPSVFTYNSATQTFVGVSGGGGLTTATAVSSRTGYSAYNFNNGAITISYRGTIERGDVPINISGVNGNFNLVPNPYPSQIDWDNVVKTNVNNAMYLRVDNNVFSSYVGGIATNPPFGGWTGEISTGQSFWVVSNGGGATLTLREADKTGNSNYFLLTAQNADDYFRIALSKEGGMRDEIVLRFADNASDAFDPEFDARKLTNFSLGDPTSVAEPKPFFNLASYLAGRDESFSINTVGRLNSVKIVNLSISDVEAGEYKLDFSEMYLLKSGYNVVLVDTYENREYDVTDGFQYSFTVTKNKMTFGRDRFHLRINGESARETTSTDFAISAYPNPTSDVVYVNLSGRAVRELSEISVSTAMGVDLMRRAPTETEKSDGQLQLDLSDRPAGMYLLTLNLNGQRQVVKVIKK